MHYIKTPDGKFAGSRAKGTVTIHHNYKHGNPVEYWSPNKKTMVKKTQSKFRAAVSWLIRATVKLTVYSAVAAAIVLIIGLSFRAAFPNVVKAVETVQVDSPSPIMDKIASCESGGSHIGKNGQVLVKANDNKTIDIGKYQINLYYWGAKATELGFDLFTEKGNTDMAMWLYKNKGTGDWSASAKCWSK